jgi:hypothetical protein
MEELFSNILEHIFLLVNKSVSLRVENYYIKAECKLELISSSDPRTSHFSLHWWENSYFFEAKCRVRVTYDLLIFFCIWLGNLSFLGQVCAKSVTLLCLETSFFILSY